MSLGSYGNAVGSEVNPSASVPSQDTGFNGASGPTGFNMPFEPHAMEWTPSTDPSQGMLTAAAWSEFGEPPREYGKPTHDVNETIQQQHVVMPWSDGSQFRIHKYMPVFTARVLDKEERFETNITLQKLNVMLQQAHLQFESVRNAGDTNAIVFQHYLNYYGERQLEAYHRLNKDGTLDELNKGDLFSGPENGDITISETTLFNFHEKSTQDLYRYQTKFGILNRWNFWGIVLNTNASDTGDGSYMGMIQSEIRSTIVNTVVQGTAVMYNFAGNVHESTPFARIWLILRRTMKMNGEPGHFEIVPFVSAQHETPPERLCTYLESNEPYPRYARAHIWDLGVIRYNSTRDAPDAIREMAIGMSVTEELACQTMASLPQVTVELGI